MSTCARYEGLVKALGVIGTVVAAIAGISCMLLGQGWTLVAAGLGLTAGSWQLLEYWDKQTRDEALERYINMYN